MNWNEVKAEIIKQLKSEIRDLKTDRRLLALDVIDNILPPIYKTRISILKQIGKDSIISELSSKKKLHSAEVSIINNIFSVLNGEPIPIKKRKE